MSRCLATSFLLLSVCIITCPVVTHARQDEDATLTKKSSKKEARTSAAKSPRRSTEGRPSAKEKEGGEGNVKRDAPPALAEISITVSPPDSTILLDGVEHRAENGTFRQAELKPGTHKIVVRRAGYREVAYDLGVAAGDRTPLSVTLKPAPGSVNVSPDVADATVSIINAETGSEVGRYDGRASGVELAPGRYQVVVSKSGYRTTAREVTVEPAGTVYIEPSLVPLPSLPAERGRVGNRSFRGDTATQLQSTRQGKFVVASLSGRSGSATNAVGSVDVTLDANGGGAGNVSGMLTGFPCQVDLVRLENVAEYSFVEPPGIGNQWGRVVVRLRPKDSKRAMHFLINWKSLQDAPPSTPP
jgi:hypothetical protein